MLYLIGAASDFNFPLPKRYIPEPGKLGLQFILLSSYISIGNETIQTLKKGRVSWQKFFTNQ
jgi:hypothetical protein